MQVPPEHIGVNAATAMFVGPENVELPGVVQSTWNFQKWSELVAKYYGQYDIYAQGRDAQRLLKLRMRYPRLRLVLGDLRGQVGVGHRTDADRDCRRNPVRPNSRSRSACRC